MKLPLNIKNKLLFAFIVTSLTPLLFISYLSTKLQEQTIVDLYTNQAEVMTSSSIYHLSSYLDGLIRKIKSLQYNVTVGNNLQILFKTINNRSSLEYQRAKATLDNELQTLQRRENINDVFLTDMNGVVFYNANYSWEYLGTALKQLRIKNMKENDIYISPIFLNKISHDYIILIAIPLIDANQKIIGSLVIEVPLINAFFNIVSESIISISKTTEIILGKQTKQGILAVSPLNSDYNSIFKTILNRTPLPDVQSSTYSIATDYTGQQAVFSWKPIPKLGLLLVFKTNVSDIFSPIDQFRRYLYAGVVITTILSILFAIYLAILITNPILKLASYVKKSEKDKLIPNIDSRLLIKNDEISELATAFQEKSIQLNQYLNQLNAVNQQLEDNSQTLKVVNENLIMAQYIARLGYWAYDQSTGLVMWSKELQYLFDSHITLPTTYQEMIQLIHVDDVDRFKKMVENVFSKKNDFECEIRFKNIEEHYRWYFVIGRPKQEDNQLYGVLMDITKRKEVEAEVKSLNKKLILTARQAGMSEVATSILHNVGNILNSMKVSTELLKEKLINSQLDKLIAIANLIQEHLNDIDQYLKNDKKGKLLPSYFIALSKALDNEHYFIKNEIDKLIKCVLHVEDVVSMQNSLGGMVSLIEKIYLPEVIDIALSMCNEIINKNQIQIQKEIDSNLFLNLDQTKLLQILVNLIRNAADAMSIDLIPISDRKILIRVELFSDTNTVNIKVIDNGIGIEQENLIKIFSLGFTTKPKGHGFGLHSCALLAKEMHGKLVVESEGLGKGTTFVLTLPIDFSLTKTESTSMEESHVH